MGELDIIGRFFYGGIGEEYEGRWENFGGFLGEVFVESIFIVRGKLF